MTFEAFFIDSSPPFQEDEPKALKFRSLSESEQYKIDLRCEEEATKIDRLAKSVTRLMRGLKLYDKEQ